jgi:hypothetical protein
MTDDQQHRAVVGSRSEPTTQSAEPQPSSADRAPTGFFDAFHEFVATVWALNELAAVVAPAAEHLDVPKWVLALEEMIGDFPDLDSRRTFRRTLVEGLERARRGEEMPESPTLPAPRKGTRPRVRRLDAEALVDAVMQDVREGSAHLRPGRQVLLMRSLLTSLIASLEVLLGNLVASFYRSRPAAISDRDKEFSLADLKRFETVADAVEEAIATRVDSFLRDGPHDWEKWFAKVAKVSFAELSTDLDGLLEVLQRRHIIVHNNGQVSRRYLSNVTDRFQKVAVGDVLAVDESYFERAVELVLEFGSLLAACVWAHVTPEPRSEAGRGLQRLTERAMDAEWWSVVEHVTHVASQRVADNEMSRMIFQMNYWLARKRRYGPDAVRDEIENFDHSALAPVLRFVWLALLDRHEEAVAGLDELLESRQITYRELRDWWVLAELRERPEVQGRLKKLRAAERRRNKRRSARRVAVEPGTAEPSSSTQEANWGAQAHVGAEGRAVTPHSGRPADADKPFPAGEEG